MRFYPPGLRRRNFRPWQNGCSAWLHRMNEVAESTAGRPSSADAIQWLARTARLQLSSRSCGVRGLCGRTQKSRKRFEFSSLATAAYLDR